MLKKPASGVLASLRGSTYRSVRLASSLATALLNSLFEHPADYRHNRAKYYRNSMSRKLLAIEQRKWLELERRYSLFTGMYITFP